jgi:transcription elongation factor GreB
MVSPISPSRDWAFLSAAGAGTLGRVSKAFTREDDLPDTPVPPLRASGEVRYVTPEGMKSLSDELASLDPSSRRGQLLAATLPLLVVKTPPCDGTVAFGCWVTVRDEKGTQSVWRIVGPDEADARARRLSVASPIARALLGKLVGDTATVELPRGTVELDIVGVSAEPPREATP